MRYMKLWERSRSYVGLFYSQFKKEGESLRIEEVEAP